MQTTAPRPAAPSPEDLADLVRGLGRNSATLLAMGVVLLIAGLSLVVVGIAIVSTHS